MGSQRVNFLTVPPQFERRHAENRREPLFLGRALPLAPVWRGVVEGLGRRADAVVRLYSAPHQCLFAGRHDPRGRSWLWTMDGVSQGFVQTPYHRRLVAELH